MTALPAFKKKKFDFIKQRTLPLFILLIGVLLCFALVVVSDRPVPEDKRIKAVLPETDLGENIFSIKGQDISAQEVLIHDNGHDYTVYVSSGTINDAIAKAGIKLNELDELSYSTTDQIYDGIELTITRVTTEVYSVYYPEPYTTVKQTSSALPEGVEKLVQTGKDGERCYNYQIVYRNGIKSETELISTEVTTKAVNEIYLCGTEDYYRPEINYVIDEENKTITTDEGIVFTYTDIVNVSATAYTTEGYRNKITYSGEVANYGIIAVDPRVIPLGTKMFVADPDNEWVYGYCIAGDTGGMIKGNRVDLFYDTRKECINFGRQKAAVYILE